MSEVFVVAAARTPPLTFEPTAQAPGLPQTAELSHSVLAEAQRRSGVRADRLDGVYWSADDVEAAGLGAQWMGAPVAAVRGGTLGGQLAVHLAAQAALSGDADVALAGGAARGVELYSREEVRQITRELAEAEGIPTERLRAVASRRKAAERAAADALVPMIAEDGSRTETDFPAGRPKRLAVGAAALALASPAAVGRYNLVPRARIGGRAFAACEPVRWWQAGVAAAQQALEREGIEIGEVGLLAFNEPCAGPGIVVLRELGADAAKVRPWGGTRGFVRAGPAAGGMILADLIAELERTNRKTALLVGWTTAGTACATFVERV